MTHTDPIKALVERLQRTTERMANNCQVDVTLWDEHSNACLAAIEALKPMADGTHVMVPRELTPEMIKAGLEVKWLPDVKFGPRVADIYKAMLAAAPPASPAPVDGENA